jgi:hypothetical protein
MVSWTFAYEVQLDRLESLFSESNVRTDELSIVRLDQFLVFFKNETEPN